MMDNRASTEYKLIIKICDQKNVQNMIRLDYVM